MNTLTASQRALAQDLARELPKQPAVIMAVVRWAANLILTEREACAVTAEDLAHGRCEACRRDIALAIRARS